MDHESLVMNGSSGNWTIREGMEVTLTFLEQYYAGRGVVVRMTSTNPLLVLVSVIEVSDAIEIPLPFLVDNVRHISQCAGKELSGKLNILSHMPRSTTLMVLAGGRYHLLSVPGPTASTLT
jgi:hypothetical protein